MDCLQEKFAPHSACFGCGPANPKGLRVRSVPAGSGDEWAAGKVSPTSAEWRAQPEHEAFPGMLNGGIVGALLDCHSNWTAAWHLMKERSEQAPPCTVTAEFHVKLARPTPTSGPIRVEAWVLQSEGDSVQVESQLIAGGKVTARCSGKFVAVKPGHPAYHRW
jgi:acyl-coenzyme A thioesterase PaaI-like protein